MFSYDTAKIRDGHFRERFSAKWAEIQAVRKANRFVTYATNHDLFEELKEIYQENLKAYQTYYEANLRRYNHALKELEKAEGHIHPIRYKNIQKLIQQAGQKLETEDYQTNAAASEILTDFNKLIEAARAEYTGWEKQLTVFRLRLKEIMTDVWAEDFAALKASYQATKSRLQGELLPHLPIVADEEKIQTAIKNRAVDVNNLKRKLRRHSQMLKAVDEVEGKYYSKADFISLGSGLLRRRNMRLAINAMAILLLLSLAGLIIWYAPQWYNRHADQQDWVAAQSENTIEAYKDYLENHPEGTFIIQADSALMAVDSGSLNGLIDSRENVFDYTGKLEKLAPMGTGIGVFADGSVYEGEWIDGKRMGKGKWILPDSSIYNGNWKNDTRQGWGVMEYEDGRLYRGTWHADTFHGKGTLIYPDSSIYQGDWVSGQRNGSGTWQSADGLRYEGSWKDDQCHGSGTLLTAKGMRYIGNWQNGLLEGEVKQEWPSGMLFQGIMKAGKKQGRGSVNWPGGGAFSGTWVADTINGRGKFVSRFRNEYTGVWKGTLDGIILYDGQGNVFKKGKIQDGIFLGE